MGKSGLRSGVEERSMPILRERDVKHGAEKNRRSVEPYAEKNCTSAVASEATFTELRTPMLRTFEDNFLL